MADSGGGRGRGAAPPGAGRPPWPTISPPPWSAHESPSQGDAAAGEGPSEVRPPPLTPLSSSFFEDVESEIQCFAQLVRGAMNSFAGAPPPPWALGEEPKEAERDSGGELGLQNVEMTEPSLIFTVPPGFSPSRLLDSGNSGMSHQLVVTQDTAQAVQTQFQMHDQAGCSSSHSAATAASLSWETGDVEQMKVVTRRIDEGGDNEQPDPKRRKIPCCSQIMVRPMLVIETRSQIDPPDDGYKWHYNMQRVLKGNPNPRRYYTCTHAGCDARKHIQRSSTEPSVVATTYYKGKHNHPAPAARNSNDDTANNNTQWSSLTQEKQTTETMIKNQLQCQK